MREDVGLDGVLELVGEFVAVGAEDFDAVVFPRIVRRGDDDARGEFVFTREIGNAGRGDDSGADDFDARGLESGGEDLADPGAGLAGVLTDDDAGVLAALGETLAECASDGVDGRAVEWIFTRDAANAVGSKKLSFEFGWRRSAQGWPAPREDFPVVTVTWTGAGC